MSDLTKESLMQHAAWRGKLETVPKMKVDSREALAIAYTPGVAAPCIEISKNPSQVYTYTGKGNTVAVITDGSAVLGLGDIGGPASMPVMEGKCVLFKSFANIDAVPVCVATKDVDEFVRTVELIAPSFGGINLEDISAPRCFEIEARLKERCDIPVFHDDQHGTAIVVSAAMQNALKIRGSRLEEMRVVFSGAGAAGIAIYKLLRTMGMKNAILFDKDGPVYDGRPDLAQNPVLAEIAAETNREGFRGSLAEGLVGADAFIGVSAPGLVTADMVRTMNIDPILFALANPVPEILPDEAAKGGARLVGTGRSDFPNQINNVLAFPGVFRGALDAGARAITEEMKVAAAQALAELVGDDLAPDHLLPEAFDKRVCPAVAQAVGGSTETSMMERWDAYDDDGKPLGFDLIRGALVPEGVFNAVAEIVVRHKDGTYLVIQRDWSKKTFPGLWEIGASGAVQKGEAPIDGAFRELREETSIAADELTFLYRLTDRHTHFYCYFCETGVDKQSLTMQPGETMDYRWLTREELNQLLQAETFVPTQSLRVLRHLKEMEQRGYI